MVQDVMAGHRGADAVRQRQTCPGAPFRSNRNRALDCWIDAIC